MKFRIFSLFLLLLSLYNECTGLNILSFNVRQFGVSKYSKQDVIDILINIVKSYDLVLIIELVDVSQTVLPGFVNQLNQEVAASGIQYNYSVSQRVGRTHIKEQYAFIYKVDALKVLSEYQYPDTNDIFERPPYAILVETINTERILPAFFLIASHTRPSDAYNEINHLDNVFDAVSTNFSNKRGMILGDLNADCNYVSQTNYRTLDLVINTTFTWWIGNEIDTTTGNSDCSYDRIITSNDLSEYVVNGSARVVLFDSQYNLNATQTAAVSDHYPVQIVLEGESSNSASFSSTCCFVMILFLLFTTFM